jgi:hypothetical protein
MKKTIAALVLCLSSVGFAQKEPKPKEIIFEDPDIIDGDKEHPFVSVVDVKSRIEFDSLINVRTDFKDKTMQSVGDLQ